MSKKSTTDTCCLTLPLVLEKWQKDKLEKRFEIARQIYNTLLNYELKKLRILEENPDYIEITEKIKEEKSKEKTSNKDLNKLYNIRNTFLKNAGFSEYSFKYDMKPFYKHFNDNIKSNVAVHGIASQVWQAFDKMFFGNGKTVHFKKCGEITSLKGYSASGKSGGIEIIYRETYIEWNGLRLLIKIDKNNLYEQDMLKKRVKYCRIIRKRGKNADHWYVQLSLEGRPTIKVDSLTGEIKHPIGHGAVGIDIGPRTIAIVSNNEVSLLELADKVENIEKQKNKLQRRLDRSRRALNPDNFNKDGTIKRGIKLVWIKSKNYIKCQKELAYIHYRQAEIRKRQHTDLANHILSLGDRIYIEDMQWSSLTHRAKETQISEKTGRFKKKKRFGKSVGNKAPATLTRILKLKLESNELGFYIKVPTTLKASQFNHMTKEYVKKDLSERWNVMPDGKMIQRDLYSAFLLQHTNTNNDGFNIIELEKDYDNFVKLHDQQIERLRSIPKTIASMGIVRTKR